MSRKTTRVTVTFYWPWARVIAAIKSRRAAKSGNQDKKVDIEGNQEKKVDTEGNQKKKIDIKGKQAAQKVAGSRRTRAWTKKGADTKKKASKDDDKAKSTKTKDNPFTGCLPVFIEIQNLFHRSPKRTSVQYLYEGDGEEVWYKRRQMTITQHMGKMREAIHKRAKAKEFNDLEDDDDILSQLSLPAKQYPWWCKKWWNLFEAGDPVIEKTPEELADTTAMKDRLRSLRLELGLAEEWMQKEIEQEMDISDVISLDEESLPETPRPPENPWVVISSFFTNPSLALTQSPYPIDGKHALPDSMINNTVWMNQKLPGMRPTQSPDNIDDKQPLPDSIINNTAWMNQTLPGMSEM